MSRLIVRALHKYFAAFIKDYSSELIDVSLGKGEVNLDHLELKEETLRSLLRVPPGLEIRRIALDGVQVKVPWTSLKTAPVVVTLGKVTVEIEEPDTLRPYEPLPKFLRPKAKSAKQLEKEEKKRRKKEAAERKKKAEKGEEESKRKLLDAIVENLQLDIAELALTVRVRGHDALSEADRVAQQTPPAISFAVERINLCSADAAWNVTDVRELYQAQKGNAHLDIRKILTVQSVHVSQFFEDGSEHRILDLPIEGRVWLKRSAKTSIISDVDGNLKVSGVQMAWPWSRWHAFMRSVEGIVWALERKLDETMLSPRSAAKLRAEQARIAAIEAASDSSESEDVDTAAVAAAVSPGGAVTEATLEQMPQHEEQDPLLAIIRELDNEQEQTEALVGGSVSAAQMADSVSDSVHNMMLEESVAEAEWARVKFKFEFGGVHLQLFEEGHTEEDPLGFNFMVGRVDATLNSEKKPEDAVMLDARLDRALGSTRLRRIMQVTQVEVSLEDAFFGELDTQRYRPLLVRDRSKAPDVNPTEFSDDDEAAAMEADEEAGKRARGGLSPNEDGRFLLTESETIAAGRPSGGTAPARAKRYIAEAHKLPALVQVRAMVAACVDEPLKNPFAVDVDVKTAPIKVFVDSNGIAKLKRFVTDSLPKMPERAEKTEAEVREEARKKRRDAETKKELRRQKLEEDVNLDMISWSRVNLSVQLGTITLRVPPPRSRVPSALAMQIVVGGVAIDNLNSAQSASLRLKLAVHDLSITWVPYDPTYTNRHSSARDRIKLLHPFGITAVVELKDYVKTLQEATGGSKRNAGSMIPDAQRAEISVVISGLFVQLTPWTYGCLLQAYAGIYNFFMARKKRFPTSFPPLDAVLAIAAMKFPFYLRLKLKRTRIHVNGPPENFEWIRLMNMPLDKVAARHHAAVAAGTFQRLMSMDIGGIEVVVEHRLKEAAKIKLVLYSLDLNSTVYIIHSNLPHRIRPNNTSVGQGTVDTTHTIVFDYSYMPATEQRKHAHTANIRLTGMRIELEEHDGKLDGSGMGKLFGQLGMVLARDPEFGEAPPVDSTFPKNISVNVDFGDTEVAVVRHDAFDKFGRTQIPFALIRLEAAEKLIMSEHSRKLEAELANIRADHTRLLKTSQQLIAKLESDLLERDQQLITAKVHAAQVQSQALESRHRENELSKRSAVLERERAKVREQNQELFRILEKSKALAAAERASPGVRGKGGVNMSVQDLLRRLSEREIELEAKVAMAREEAHNYRRELEAMQEKLEQQAATHDAALDKYDRQAQKLLVKHEAMMSEVDGMRQLAESREEALGGVQADFMELGTYCTALEQRLAYLEAMQAAGAGGFGKRRKDKDAVADAPVVPPRPQGRSFDRVLNRKGSTSASNGPSKLRVPERSQGGDDRSEGSSLRTSERSAAVTPTVPQRGTATSSSAGSKGLGSSRGDDDTSDDVSVGRRKDSDPVSRVAPKKKKGSSMKSFLKPGLSKRRREQQSRSARSKGEAGSDEEVVG